MSTEWAAVRYPVYFAPISMSICFTRIRSSPSKPVTHTSCNRTQSWLKGQNLRKKRDNIGLKCSRCYLGKARLVWAVDIWKVDWMEWRQQLPLQKNVIQPMSSHQAFSIFERLKNINYIVIIRLYSKYTSLGQHQIVRFKIYWLTRENTWLCWCSHIMFVTRFEYDESTSPPFCSIT